MVKNKYYFAMIEYMMENLNSFNAKSCKYLNRRGEAETLFKSIIKINIMWPSFSALKIDNEFFVQSYHEISQL